LPTRAFKVKNEATSAMLVASIAGVSGHIQLP
jgi:hypothetical protein